MFQSAPCTRVQGDNFSFYNPALDVVVSIRSLHQSTGRSRLFYCPLNRFAVSIRSLHQSTGRCPLFERSHIHQTVSIRSLHQSTGRFPLFFTFPMLTLSFNPLPAPEYREIFHAFQFRPIFKVSIRSLHQSTGR